MVLEHCSQANRINTGTMTELSALAATLLTNFVTVKLRRCEALWTWPVDNPSLELHCRLLQATLRAQMMILGCNRMYLRQRLLDDGHRAFFDYLESDGPEGWRLHFFCRSPSAVAVLQNAGLGECRPGDPVRLDPKRFVMRRLRCLERCGRIDSREDWCWFLD